MLRDPLVPLFVKADPAIPYSSQLFEVRAAFFFVAESLHDPVPQKQIPFIRVPMLEDAVAGEIMLAHRADERLNAPARHAIAAAQLSEGQMEGFLIPVNVSIQEVRLLVIPEA